jgi:hypothetical protein
LRGRRRQVEASFYSFKSITLPIKRDLQARIRLRKNGQIAPHAGEP